MRNKLQENQTGSWIKINSHRKDGFYPGSKSEPWWTVRAPQIEEQMDWLHPVHPRIILMINHLLKQNYYSNQKRTFVDASFNHDLEIGKIGIVTYSNESLMSTHILEDIPTRSVNVLELQAVHIGATLYPSSRLHTDSQYAHNRAGKLKNRLYLINGKYNPADKLLRNEDVPTNIDLHELVINWSLSNHDSTNPLVSK